LRPQAVLCHPKMASVLAAARTIDGWCQRVAPVSGQTSFAGLPVIACPELAQGAMVV
jgi:hypothetical protein